jgi:hypothetical protein
MTMTRVLKRPALDIFREAQRYLHLRTEKLAAERKFKAASDPVRKWLNAKNAAGGWLNGTEDDEGNRVLYFDRAVTSTDGKIYDGVMLRRAQAAATFDSDEVLAFARTLRTSLQVRLIKTIEVPDLDELYVLQQKGEITEKQLRSLMHEPAPTYSLWPLEATEITEE